MLLKKPGFTAARHYLALASRQRHHVQYGERFPLARPPGREPERVAVVSSAIQRQVSSRCQSRFRSQLLLLARCKPRFAERPLPMNIAPRLVLAKRDRKRPITRR